MKFDLIVIGGGPGGSTVATLVAKTGKKVLLLERDAFPRHQIGESLLPMTVHGICPMLGVKDELAAQNFPVKTGSTFRWGRSQELWSFEFAGLKILGEANAGYAYQVERSKFDSILLDNARRQGVDVRQEHSVTGLIIEGERVVGVRFTDPKGQEHTARAQVVADVSGNTSVVASHVGERVYSKFFRNVAMFGYFTGGKRLPAPGNWGNILSAAFAEGWFWYIPLSKDLTSVGAVIDKRHVDLLRGDKDAAFARLVDSCPIIKDYLGPAKRVTEGTYGSFRIRKDWSYVSTRMWRPGIVTLGDSAAFIDPIFSQGVHLATYSGLLAARSINTMLDTPRADEKSLFDEFERRYRLEIGRFYNFLVAFYDMEQDVEGYYWSARKFNQTEEKANDAFISLVAGVSSGEFFAKNAQSSRKFQEYTEASNSKAPAEAESYVWGSQLGPGSDLIEAGSARLAGRYVPSVDGLHWQEA